MATKAKKKYEYLTKALQLPDGTRKYIRAKTQEELDEKVLQAQILVKSGVDICNEETFGHFAQIWFDIYKKPYLREKSQDAIKYVLNHQILPVLGGYRLRDICPMQIQALMAGLAGKSNSLQSKVLIHLRSIFGAAVENGLIAKSPVSRMLKPSGKRTEEKVALTPEECDLLLSRVQDARARTFLLIALHTGMRRGEIIGLLWEDIDFQKIPAFRCGKRQMEGALLLQNLLCGIHSNSHIPGRQKSPLVGAAVIRTNTAVVQIGPQALGDPLLQAVMLHQPLAQRLVSGDLRDDFITVHTGWLYMDSGLKHLVQT